MLDVKTVLHVINSLGISGGAEQQLVSNLQRFTDGRLRHAIAYLYSYDFETRNEQVPAGVTLYPLREIGERRGQWTSVRRLSRLVDEVRPDLIHCALAEAAVASRIVGRLRGIPVVESLVNISHEPIRCVDNPNVTPTKLRFHMLLDRATMRGVTHFQALSPAVSQSWQRVVGLDPQHITVIPRGIDMDELTQAAQAGPGRAALLAELGIPESAFVLVAVGRHEAQKGHRYAIEAMPAILREVPDAVLLIAGRPGNRTPSLRRAIHDLALDQSVHLLGRRRDIAAIVAAADLFVFPSLFEGLGVSLLEAMALGAACLVSDAPPMNATISDGMTGLVFEPMDSAALAEVVVRAAHDPALRSALGERANDEIHRHYRLDDTARRVERLLLKQAGLTPPDSV